MRPTTPTDSQKFMLFWLALLAGIAIGSHIILPVALLGWLGALWLVLVASGQDDRIETVSAIALGLIGGLLAWQLTDGETWVPLAAIGGAIEKIEAIRATLIDRIFLTLPEPHGSLLTGILIGNRAKLDPELLETFRVVGLSHIIAVSGYNLSILTSNLRSILWPVIGRRAIFVALTVIVVFVILSGAPASILRAAVMASALLLAQFFGRPSRSLNVLVFAAGLLAVFEPKIIFEISFQLSIAATYGLIRLGPVVVGAFERFKKIPESLRLIIGETLAATIITAPILVLYFDRLSLISPVTNILVLPIIPLLMGVGIAGCFLLFAVPAIGQYLIHLTWPLLEWVVWVSQKLAALPYAATTIDASRWLTLSVLLALVLAIELVYGWWRNRTPEPELITQRIRS